MGNTLFVPGGIYQDTDGTIMEYVSTSGKNDRDSVRGLRFYDVSNGGRELVIIQADDLGERFAHVDSVEPK